MTKQEIIKKIVEIDAKLSNNRFDRRLTVEQTARLRSRRNHLEKQLYK